MAKLPHPEHAKTPLVLPSLCRASTLHYGPILAGLPGELNRSDGCGASPGAPGQVRAHTSPSLTGPSSPPALGAAPAGMPWILHGKLSKWCWETSPSDQSRVPGKDQSFYYTRLKQEESDGIWEAANILEQKFTMNFAVAKFRLLPWGTSLQGVLLWEIKWQECTEGNLLLLSWKPPPLCSGERQEDRAGPMLEQFSSEVWSLICPKMKQFVIGCKAPLLTFNIYSVCIR